MLLASQLHSNLEQVQGCREAAIPWSDALSRAAPIWLHQPELDFGQVSLPVLSSCSSSNILGHMTVEDLRPVFKGQGVHSAAWQELLSLQHDAQLEIRLVLDPSEAAHPSPHNLRFPLSAILPDEQMLRQEFASEATSLAKLADPILTWLDAQPNAATANSIEVGAQQADSAAYDEWDDNTDHADAYWQWQDACRCTSQQPQQPSWQLPADVDCPMCPPDADGCGACETQHHPSLHYTDPADSATHSSANAGSYLSPDASPSIASAQQLQVAAPPSSNYGTAAADGCWHPDTDLAVLQRRLQHVKSGADLVNLSSKSPLCGCKLEPRFRPKG